MGIKIRNQYLLEYHSYNKTINVKLTHFYLLWQVFYLESVYKPKKH